MTAQSTFTFHHPDLGPMTGILSPDNVVQFRAVPYATIPARFKQSILLDSVFQHSKDFTKHGYVSVVSSLPGMYFPLTLS